MAKEIEIEFKNLLTKEEFENLKTFFQINESRFRSQTNYYFETPSFSIKEHGGALRIRKKSATSYTLTLKIRQTVGHLEINQKISESEASNMLETSVLPDGEVKEYINEVKLNLNDLNLIGELTTNRVEFPYEDGLLVLDHSTYLNHEDYELEFEVTDENIGKQQFINLLMDHQIPERKTLNKIKRFFNVKNELDKK
ncbi:CYTH domain-containing protein [Bacillus sp. AFS017336]|uniref:CYTH domain-containing protein n=1 Tax=Bacillus sp. AFS017336 TaxID=2033489 RepID=UPI000BF0AA00|nr:CYTH domain-containing protein [Bacillus sp. AFS017336]PEK99468.1 CYTH domain-containing protein [Bacillus sp. AFS017336]